MTGTNFQRKKSEHGASLLLLVGIIGLAFIVTVAAFLVAASNGQDTARFASAKVDIATREDALMREILQQAATGVLPGADGVTGTPAIWNTIMTSAVTQLRATSYVDPAELATLGLTGVITANTGDTGGTPLGIFQGYNQEVPFGGTSGLLNSLSLVSPSPSPYNPAVEPPLMGWSSANGTLSSTIALTTPQEFFLGSLYTSTSTPVTTDIYSKRWGMITYPNIRFGYKAPGDTHFIARRVWWRIPVVYQTTQQTIEDQANVMRYPSVTANYVLSIFEVPSQLPISGNANLQIGLWGTGLQVGGSIYGGQIQLSGGTYSGDISSRQNVNILTGNSTVNQVLYPSSLNNSATFDQLGTRESMAVTQVTPGAAPVSVAGNDGKVLVVPVMPGSNFYMPVSPSSTPTHWDLYGRAYYKCRIRIMISGTGANSGINNLIYSPNRTAQANAAAATNLGAISVTINVWPDSFNLPDQVLGFPDTTAGATTYGPYTQSNAAAGGLPPYMHYTSTGTGTVADLNVLTIDVLQMVALLGNPTQLYSIYIGTNPANPLNDPAVAITDTNNLSAFTNGLSIVSNQPLYLVDSFNQTPIATTGLVPPTSLYAPKVLYGMSQTAVDNVVVGTTAFPGQISLDPSSTATPPVNPLSFTNGAGSAISSVSGVLGEIISPNQVPPITRMSLIFTIEKERTN